MPTISIKRRHTLSHTEAKAAADTIARDLNKRFDLTYEWDRDDVSFERPGLPGTCMWAKMTFAWTCSCRCC